MTKLKHIDSEYTISEAYRYLANAKETIAKSPIAYGRYSDSKYVRKAAGMVYLAALKALDVYFVSQGIKQAELPQSIEEYMVFIKKKIPLNGKLSAAMTIVYQNMHIFAYYRGGTALQMVKEGFENARKIIDMINKLLGKTTDHNLLAEPQAPYKTKRIVKKIKVNN